MRLNFRKISAFATSALLVGMSIGVAAAASYPAPFIEGGVANVGIVYGTGEGVSYLDHIEAAHIQTDLQSKLGVGTGGTEASTSGETVSLDTSNTRIYLNTSLNTAKSQITKSDLPTVLADYTFSGNVQSKVTHTVKLVTGNIATAATTTNTGTVMFAKQPESSDDPVIGLSLGASQASYPLYNASATMGAVNFTHADSKGQSIELFGQKFTVSADNTIADTTKVVLLKEAEKVSLDSNNPSATVTIGDNTYTVELISASDTAANIQITDSAGTSDNREINEADSKRVNGVDVAVLTADETNLKLSASIIVGAEKITLTDGSVVTVGESEDPIDGTYAYVTGGAGACTELAIAVFRPSTTDDAILPGETFVDPVFGSFKFDFAGLSSPLDDATRDTIKVDFAGVKDMQLTLTADGETEEKTLNFAHNESSQLILGDTSNYSIGVVEMANLSTGTAGTKYIVLGNEDYGHILELYDVYNQTTGTNSVTNDRVKFKDVLSDDLYATDFVSTEASGTLDVDGKRYTVTFSGTGDEGWVQVKYPTTDSADANTYAVYPTIKTKSGALVALYKPLTIDMADLDKAGTQATTITLNFPDGDGYTGFTATGAGNATTFNWTIDSSVIYTGDATLGAYGGAVAADASLTVGQLTYSMNTTTTVNDTLLYLNNPETGVQIDQPALIIFEGKDDKTTYQAIVVDLETNPAGTSSDGLGIEDIFFSSSYAHYEATQATDTDITEHVDWWGTHVLVDSNTASQKKATITYPNTQVYTQLYVGEDTSVVTAGTTGTTASSTPLGEVLYKDSETSMYGDKNLIIIGGSCINSAAAALVGGAYCGQAWTDATNIGAGEFMIKGYAATEQSLTTKLALLVAGYNQADTVNAAKYLRNKLPDTSSNWKGSSSTNAELVTEAA